ncbi:hypothetical protein [Ruminococcus flavefaciens]|uniref:hypothetical protein n=1 Tax=Ruminococcus flavefaciens TaxID=1265 RepID=UPI0002EC3881|nr:hypothetical protein [Ruminococcus flavefaciens]
MKNTIKKIAASISAAVLCALPVVNSLTANAYAGPDAMYTYRKVYYSPYNSNIDRVIFSWNINSNGTSAPTNTRLAAGTLQDGGSGAPNHHIGGGNFYPTNSAVTGRIFSQSFYSVDTSITEYSNNIYVYNKNNQLVNSGVRTFPTMLVGDIDGDNDVDSFDFSLINHVINVEGYRLSNITSPHSFKGVELNGRHYTVYSYQLDIDNDGDVDSTDFDIYAEHNNGSFTKRFDK